MHKITLSFSDINVSPSDYNGKTYISAYASIINIACDFIMHYYFTGYNEMDCIFNPERADVNMVAHTVTLDVAQYRTH